jgi:hypothetical protein
VRASFAAAIGLVAVAAVTPARADEAPPPTLRANEYSKYELEEIDDALAARGLVREETAEGKVVEGIDIVALDVIDRRDPAPSFINIFHATTRDWVVDREVLVRPGEPYRQVLVDETIRNLKAKTQLSLVVALPVRGSAPDRVRILVITKDVWSLRLNWSLQASSGGLEDLVIQPSEINFLGTHQSASLYFERDPATLTFGVGYREPRLAGTRIVLATSANAIVNHLTGKLEGSSGELLAYQPLYSGRTEWGWASSVQWDQEINRRFVNAQETLFEKAVPWEYAVRRYLAQESVTRSFGWDVKHDFSVGAMADLREYPTSDLAAYDPALVAQFVTAAVPRSDKRLGPFVEYHGYQNRFLRVHDLQTLALQEDFRLGHDVYVRVYPIAKAFGSSRDVLGTYAAAQYTWPIFGDGLVRAQIETTTEAEVDRISDAYVAGGGEIVTPELLIGRFVYDVHAQSRYRNYLNQQTFLGGNTRLRGYPTNYLAGKDIVTSNLEFRMRPIEVLRTLEAGVAVFYDVGDAFNGYDNLHLLQSVGAGARLLFPQLDRAVFRIDVGVPVGDGARGVAAPAAFFVAYEQAFSMPALTAVALPSGP